MGEHDYTAVLSVTNAIGVFLYWRFRKADGCDGERRPQLAVLIHEREFEVGELSIRH
jgi:hypothetical protein